MTPDTLRQMLLSSVTDDERSDSIPGGIPLPEAQIIELQAYQKDMADRQYRQSLKAFQVGDIVQMARAVGPVKNNLKERIAYKIWKFLPDGVPEGDVHLTAMLNQMEEAAQTLPKIDCLLARWDGRAGTVIFSLFWTGGLEPWPAPETKE